MAGAHYIVITYCFIDYIPRGDLAFIAVNQGGDVFLLFFCQRFFGDIAAVFIFKHAVRNLAVPAQCMAD